MTEATSNAKQVFYLLVEFDQDYGEFPSDTTAILHKNESGEAYLDLRAFKGRYSNDYLGQLIAAGYTKSEEIFYAKGGSHISKKPDNVIDSPERILEAGECGFAYYKNSSTSDNSGRPILMGPMLGKGQAFNLKPYDGKAVLLRVDGAVKQLLIDKKTGEAKVGERKTLFEMDQGTVWGEEGFDPARLKLPE